MTASLIVRNPDAPVWKRVYFKLRLPRGLALWFVREWDRAPSQARSGAQD